MTVLICVVLGMTSAGCIDEMNDIEVDFSRTVLTLVEDHMNFTVRGECHVSSVSSSHGELPRWKDFYFQMADFNGREVIPKVKVEGPGADELPGLHIILYENASGKGRIGEGDRIVIVGMDESYRGHQFYLMTEKRMTVVWGNLHTSVETFDFDVYMIEPTVWGSIAFLNFTIRIEENFLGDDGPRWELTSLTLSDENKSNNLTFALEPHDAILEDSLQVRYFDDDQLGNSMERGDTILMTKVPNRYLNGFIYMDHPGIGVLGGRRIPSDPFYEDEFYE